MKKSILSVLFCCLFGLVFAQSEVSVQDAKMVSGKFFKMNCAAANVSESNLNLIHTELGADNTPLFYVFSIRPTGFVIVSATESVDPILGYSLENNYDGTMKNYLTGVYASSIQDVKASANAAAAKEWNFYRNYEPTREVIDSYIANEVKPLVVSTWNQVTYYNNHCPIQADAVQSQSNLDCDGHTPAGCVATDMAVLMNYYRYPAYGVGGVGYRPIHYVRNSNDEIIDTIIYPWQIQSFNVLHDYNLMPNEDIHSYTGEIAKLMWHTGISVQMDYGPDASGALSAYALECMKNIWGYNRTAQQVARSSFNQSALWINELKLEIDSMRPLYYSASDAQGGHAFILDGYQDINNVNRTVTMTSPEDIFDSIQTIEHQEINIVDSVLNEDETWNYIYDTTYTYTYDSIFHTVYNDSIVTIDTTFSHTLFHVNWGWGGYNNGYFKMSGAGYLDGYTKNEATFTALYPVGDPEKETEGQVNVNGTRGAISDGAGNKLYRPNTDRTWMISAPEATKYTFKFLRLETEAGADEVIFYKNGTTEAGRYSGNTVPAQFSINADSVLVRFVSNGNDVTGRGFVIDFSATTPDAYCSNEVTLPLGSGSFNDKGETNVTADDNQDRVYRPESVCTWKINGFDKLYLSYPQIELGLGDFIDIFDATNSNPNKHYILYRIDGYNWPTDDVLTIGGNVHKIKIRFVSDNYVEGNGFTMTYETETGIAENNGLSNISIYPNPASSLLNVDLTSETEGQLTFTVVDMAGRTLSAESVENFGGELHHTINVSNLSKGIYMLRIDGKQGASVRKFIVE